MAAIRLGEILIRQGVLTESQVNQILMTQRSSQRPFGLLAEQMFGLSPNAVERAWAEQYAAITEHIDVRIERKEADALAAVDRRQAWQFCVFPLRFENGELMLATLKKQLPRALRFASRCVNHPCYLVITERRMLGEALAEHYPMGGLGPDSLPEETTDARALVGYDPDDMLAA